MQVRPKVRRWLSPSLFALIALCFLLPFGTVSCDTARTTFTGVQLVTWTVPAGGWVNEGSDCIGDLGSCVEHQASFGATVALVAAAIGLLLGLLGVVRGPGWFALVGIGALLWDGLNAIGSLAGVTFRYGYVLALLLFAWVGVLHLRRAWRRMRKRRDEAAHVASTSR
jgi:hypothetical protein